jgi:hypothetical protein
MTRYQYWLRTGLDRDTGKPTQNPPTINHAPPSTKPHRTKEDSAAGMGQCDCLACSVARAKASNSTYVMNEWGDVHLSVGQRIAMKHSEIARREQKRRNEEVRHEEERRSETERVREEYKRGRERER